MVDLHISILVLIAFALNVPFGAYRATTARFTARWLLAVHLPIPIILLIRVTSGYSYRVIPLLVVAAVAGQLVGSWGYHRWRSLRPTPLAVPVAAEEQAPKPYSR
jgi:pilus assembly protein TadC